MVSDFQVNLPALKEDMRDNRNDIKHVEQVLGEIAKNLHGLSVSVTMAQKQHEKRIDKLEKLGNKLLVGVTILAGGGSIVGQLIMKLFGG